jgi:hypothetical protein
MEIWKPNTAYTPGTIVEHQGKAYRKANDYDQTMPDDKAGGWEELPNNNLQQFETIEAALGSYEQRRDAHLAAVAAAKASAEAKLQALGLTVEELQALGL